MIFWIIGLMGGCVVIGWSLHDIWINFKKIKKAKHELMTFKGLCDDCIYCLGGDCQVDPEERKTTEFDLNKWEITKCDCYTNFLPENDIQFTSLLETPEHDYICEGCGKKVDKVFADVAIDLDAWIKCQNCGCALKGLKKLYELTEEEYFMVFNKEEE